MAQRPDERIEVEPISEARWGRVERSVFAVLDAEQAAGGPAPPLPPPRRRARGVVAAVALTAVAASVGALVARGVTRAPATFASSHIVTATDGSHVALASASLDVGPQAELDVSGDDEHGIAVVLQRGSVACEVAPRAGRPPFVVRAGDVRVRVVGTRFSVERDESGVHVSVTKGVVEVESHGDVERVVAGASWPPAVASPAPAASSELASPVAAPSVAPAPASSVVPQRAPAVAERPTLAMASKGTSEPVTAPSPSPSVAPPGPPAVAPRAVPATSKERYDSASLIEATDPDAALAIYRDLARGTDAWSANALYAAARLESDRGHRDRARGLLTEYLARFPRGPNAVDARDLLVRVSRPSP